MGIPKPSEARVVVCHYEDGRADVLIDGNTIPGFIGYEVEGGYSDRSILKLTIAGLGYRIETSPMTRAEARAARRQAKSTEGA